MTMTYLKKKCSYSSLFILKKLCEIFTVKSFTIVIYISLNKV